MSSKERIVWEQTHGFNSKKSQIENAFSQLSNIQENELDATIEKLKDYILFDYENKIIHSAFPMMQRSALVNENGLVRIGDDLRVYKNDRLIIIKGGDMRLTASSSGKRYSHKNVSIIYVHAPYR